MPTAQPAGCAIGRFLGRRVCWPGMRAERAASPRGARPCGERMGAGEGVSEGAIREAARRGAGGSSRSWRCPDIKYDLVPSVFGRSFLQPAKLPARLGEARILVPPLPVSASAPSADDHSPVGLIACPRVSRWSPWSHSS